MKLYDLFYKTLDSTDNIDMAIQAVERHILKRKTFLPLIISDKYDKLNLKLVNLMRLKKKIEILKLINK